LEGKRKRENSTDGEGLKFKRFGDIEMVLVESIRFGEEGRFGVGFENRGGLE